MDRSPSPLNLMRGFLIKSFPKREDISLPGKLKDTYDLVIGVTLTDLFQKIFL